MKTRFSLYLLFIVIACGITTNMSAQRSIEKNISYNYIQLPSDPIPSNKFDYVVYQNGENEVDEEAEAEAANYEARKSAFEIDIKSYYEQIAQMDKQLYNIGEDEELSLVKKQLQMGIVENQKPEKPIRPLLEFEDEKELYTLEINLFNSRLDSLNNRDIPFVFKEQLKSLINETKPRSPRVIEKKVNKVYRIPDPIIAEDMKIRGLERTTNDDAYLFFEISIGKFEKEEKISYKDGKGNLNLKYRRIASYKIFDSEKNLIDEGLISNTDNWTTEKVNVSENNAKQAFADTRKDCIQKSAQIGLNGAVRLFANRYGKPIRTRSSELCYAKGKNYNYDALTEAYDIAVNFFSNELAKDKPDFTLLEKSINVWQEELKGANYEDKKARISADIATSLQFNIAESYLWLNEFDKAFSILDDLSKTELKSRNERKLEDCRKFFKKTQDRYNANIELMADNQ